MRSHNLANRNSSKTNKNDSIDRLLNVHGLMTNSSRNLDLNQYERYQIHLEKSNRDDMNMVSQIPIGTDLHRFKTEQIKELGAVRGEVQKMIEEQKIRAMKRDHMKGERSENEQFDREQWLDDQRRNIMAGKMRRDLQALPHTNFFDPGNGYM